MLNHVNWDVMFHATGETLYMTALSVLFVFILGMLIGLTLFLTAPGQRLENKVLNKTLAAFVNIFRSIPFIILAVLLIPFTRTVFGTIFGTNAALPALILGAAPFYGRLVESALREVNKGVIEAAVSMGASLKEIIFKVLIPESLPALISGITVTAISLVSFTAMAGLIGAGGLGNLAYMEGFQRSRQDVTVVATIIVLFIVFIIQQMGDMAIKRIDKR